MKRKLAQGLMVLLAAGVSCKPHSGGGSGEASGGSVTVDAVTVQSSPREVVEEVVGSVRTKTRAVVEANVSGRIAKMPVVLGQKVNAGDLLAEIDAQEIRARFEQARAQREQAARELERATVLIKKQVSSRQEYDAAEAKFRIAEAAVREAQTLLGYARVTAPFDGVIARKLTDVGDLAAPGKPLLEIEDRGTLRFEADVPEALIGGVAAGQKIFVSIPAIGKTLPAEVVEVSPAADAASRTFLIKLNLPQENELRAGQFGRAAIPVGMADSIRVPASAVLQRGQMEMVFVARDGQAGLRLVKTGKRIGDEVEILSGLAPGDRIITAKISTLVDGQRVEAGK
jgi:RND family efflux transporter MFP subunit